MGIDARMFFLTKNRLTNEQIVSLASKLYEAYYGTPFFLYGDNHILYEETELSQDGPDFDIPHGFQAIEIDLSGGYYGPDYERGPIHEFVSIAEWLEHNVPNCAVYYGGDSSGVLAQPFDKAARAKLLKHFYTHGHRPYRGYFGSMDETKCLCTRCGIVMNNCGGGGGTNFMACGGCDEHAIVDTHTGKDLKRWRGSDPDFFTASAALQSKVDAPLPPLPL